MSPSSKPKTKGHYRHNASIGWKFHLKKRCLGYRNKNGSLTRNKYNRWIGLERKRVLVTALSFVVLLSDDALAHPHIFVESRAGFIFDFNDHLHSLRISWTYDAFTTLFLFDALDLDKDRDGSLNEEDRAAIVAGETNWPPEYNGDIYLEVAGKDYSLTQPENAVALMENDQITVAFDLPLNQPIDMSKNTAILRLYDPVFYYSYTIRLDEQRTKNLPEHCGTELVPFEPDGTTSALRDKLASLSREETPKQENVGLLFSDEVILKCI